MRMEQSLLLTIYIYILIYSISNWTGCSPKTLKIVCTGHNGWYLTNNLQAPGCPSIVTDQPGNCNIISMDLSRHLVTK